MAETALSQTPVYTARPTLRLAGQEDVRVSELLIGMRMEESEGGMSALDLRFSNVASVTGGSAEIGFPADAKLRLGAAAAAAGALLPVTRMRPEMTDSSSELS